MNVHEYSVKELAEITKKSPETVRGWIRSGKLTARKPPFCRDYIIREVDFNRFWYGDPNPEAVNADRVSALS